MMVLGIDTSNYTTSVAAFDGEKFEMNRKILDVKEGMRGIRQSDGVFIHNRELPQMIESIIKDKSIQAVGVSTRPRSVNGSYMPVFTVGYGYARAVAAAAGVPLFEYSHQDGHIMAGIHSANAYNLLDDSFLSVHLSGGTFEILLSSFNGYNFDNEIVGGTLDISAGQLIDRVGVAMGLKFPCGRELEALAIEATDSCKLPFSIDDTYVNLSGVETKLLRQINGSDPVIARTVFCYIRDVLVKTITSAAKKNNTKNVLIVGGVAANGIIRDGLSKLDNVYFASKELSTDNAVGIAILAGMGIKN